jgi:hypothetical protein
MFYKGARQSPMGCFAMSRKAGSYQFRAASASAASGQDWEDLGVTIAGRSLVIGESAPFTLTSQHFDSPAHFEHLLENFLIFAHAVCACEGI